MATPKKANQTNYGDFSFDSDLDFNFDGPMVPDDRPKRDRKAVDHVLEGVKTGIKNKFTDPSTYKNVVRDALPEGYGRAWDAIDDIQYDSSRLYDEALQEIKPRAGSIVRKLERLTPDTATKTKKYLQELSQKLSPNRHYEWDAQDKVDGGVQRMLLETFGGMEEQRERDRKEDETREILGDTIDSKRFDKNFQIFQTISSGISGVNDYLNTFQIKYQKKSLELQFRSYFALSNLASGFNEYRKVNEQFQRAIVKNTGLPEYAKIKEGERFKQIAKEKIFGSIQDNLFGTQDRVRQISGKVRKSIKNQMDDFREALATFDDMLEAGTGQFEVDKSMSELEGSDYHKGKSIGSMLGNFISEKMLGYVSGKAKNAMEKNPGIMKGNYNIGQYAVSPGSVPRAVQSQEWFTNLRDKNMAGDMLSRFIQSGLGLLKTDPLEMKIKNNAIGSEGSDATYTGVRTAQAQADVIPGVLFRILREVTAIRTGDDSTPLLSYDAKTGRFKPQKQMAQDVADMIRKDSKKSRYAQEVQESYDTFVGDEGKNIKGKEEQSVKDFISKLSRKQNFVFTPDFIKRSQEYADLSPKLKQRVSGLIRKNLGQGDVESAKTQYKLAVQAGRVQGEIKDSRPRIAKAIADGMGPELEEMGLIKQNEDGDYDIDEKAYFKLVDDGAFAKSDITLKENIKPHGNMDGKKSLKAMQQTPSFSWNYRANTGLGQQTHVGPMAQDVQRNFGDKVAPGGKEIDLVSLNGHTMAAVKELADKIGNMEGMESTQLLASIDANIKQMLALGMGMGGGTGGGAGGMGFQRSGRPGFLGIMTDLIGYGADRLGKGVGAAVGLGKGLNDKVLTPGAKGAANLFMDNKEAIKENTTNLLKTAISATGRAIGFTTSTLFNVGQGAKNMTSGILGFMKTQMTSLFNGAKDIYVKGTNRPALLAKIMKVGGYRDQLTGKIVSTMEELAKVKGNIVDAAGNIVLSIEERADGLIDSHGKPIRTLMGKAMGSIFNGLVQGTGKALSTGLNIGRLARDFGKKGVGLASGLFNRGKAKAGDAGESLKAFMEGAIEKIGSMGGGGGDCSCWEKPYKVLVQIRDILAIGKNPKRIKKIMDGSSEEAARPNAEIAKQDDRDSTLTNVMEQMRDATLVNLDPAVAEGILNINNAKIPGQAFRKEAAKRIKDLRKNLTEKFDAMKGGLDLNLPSREEIVSGAGNAASSVASMASGGMGGVFRGAANMMPGAANFLNKGVGGLKDRLGKWGAKRKAGGLLGKAAGLGGRGLGLLSGGLSAISGIASKFLGGGEENKPEMVGPPAPAPTAMSAGDYASDLLARGKERAVNAFRSAKGKIFNDKNGDGERDGGTADRKAGLEDIRAANEARKRAAIESSKAGLENNRYMGDGIGGILKMASGLFGLLTGGFGGILKMSKSLLGGAASLLGMGGKGIFKGLGRGMKGIGGLGRAGGLLARGVGGAASGAMSLGRGLFNAGGFAAGASRGIGTAAIGAAKAGGGLLSKLPGVASVASRVGGLAMGALRIGAVAGLASGGALGAVAGIASTAMAGLAAAVSSPVIVGAAIVAGVGAAGYYGYKYLTRNKLDDWQRIRAIQYGLDGTSATESFNSQVMGLEKYLEDGNIGYQGRRPYLNEKRIKPEEILSLFSIDPKDNDRIESFSAWFSDRFKPVFLHHLAILAGVDMKAKLSELDKLTNDQKLEYLSKAGFESGPYNVTASPFKGLDSLSTNVQPALDIINAKIRTLGKDQQKKVKEAIKNGETAPKGEDAKSAKSIVTSAASEISKTSALMPTPVKDKYKMPEVLKGVESAVMEDSPQSGSIAMAKTGSESSPSSSGGGGGGAKNLATASGPILDGSGGMKYVKLGKDAELEGMQPRLLKHFLAMAQEYGEATGKSIQVNEAFRSFQRQEALYRTHKGKAARPGTSMHEHGLAMDVSTVQLDELEKLGLLRKYGFTRPVGGETWHMEAAGTQGSEQLAKKDKAFADMAIQSSLGRGGGGLGSIRGSKLGTRDPKMARDLYNAGTGQKVNLDDVASKNPSSDLKSPVIDAMGTQTASETMSSKQDRISAQAGGRSPMTQGGSVGFHGSMTSAASGGSEFEKRPTEAGTPKQGEGKGDVKSQIATAAQEAGAKPEEMQLMSAIESSLKPNAKAGNAEGLNQLMPGMWGETTKKSGGKYGIKPSDSRFDVRANTIIGAEYMKGNEKIISGVRPDPNFTDKYMAHYLGPYGAKKFFAADPDEPAWKINPKAANDPINKNIFFEGGKPLSVSGMYSKIEGKVDSTAKAFGIPYTPEGLKGKLAKDNPLKSAEDKQDQPRISSTESFVSTPQSTSLYKSTETDTGERSTTKYSTPPSEMKAVKAAPSDENFRMPVSAMSAARGQVSAAPQAPITRLDEPALDVIAENTGAQLTHVKSIDRSILETIIPTLSNMADDISKMTEKMLGVDGESHLPPAAGNQGYSQAFSTPVRSSQATPSSFDNRRVLA